jgi:hypothetical protein
MSEEKLRILARAICEQLRPQGADGWHDRIEVDNEFCLFCGVTVELLRPALREARRAGRESMREEVEWWRDRSFPGDTPPNADDASAPSPPRRREGR